MRNCLLLSILFLAISGMAHASSYVPVEKKQEPKPTGTKASLALVGSADLIKQKDTLFLAPSDSKSVGVLVDYQPFNSSGFNLSAGRITDQQNRSLQNVSPVQRAYLGIGWRKLLDDAQNFGIRVDVGAIYDDHPELEKESSNLNSTKDATPSVILSDWDPVVSFGVSYRF